MKRFIEGSPPAFTARRLRTRVVQRFSASPAKIFPLLLPVRESGATHAGVPDLPGLQPTVDAPRRVRPMPTRDPRREDVWIVRRYQPDRRIELVRVNRLRTLCWSVSLLSGREGACRVVNELLLVGRSVQGNAALPEIAACHAFEMQLDEALINLSLAGGQRIPVEGAPAASADRAAGQAGADVVALTRPSPRAVPRPFVTSLDRRLGNAATTRPPAVAASARTTPAQEPL